MRLFPGVYRIAGAPVTDWKLYDTAYTERYMREPRNNEAGYSKTSALTYAKDLSRKLLVIHGITDDNVHFANTLALIEALYVAGKRAEVITLSSTHMVTDPKLNFADMSKFKKEDIEWMEKDIKPTMARLLKQPEYTPQNPKGFGCLECHTQVAAK